MKDLKEIRLNDTNLVLNGNVVTGGILPMKIAELTRTVLVKGDCVIDGPTYTQKLTIEAGDVEFKGAVFSQNEIYVASSHQQSVTFRKSVASALSIASRSFDTKLTFCSDINAKEVTLANAFVGGSIYADEVELINCVVVGGVFATNGIKLDNCIVGTFNAPVVEASQQLSLLLPTAFSQEKMVTSPGMRMYNLALADLGGLFKHQPQAPDSGRIEMNVDTDDVRTTLADDQIRKSLHSYTVVSKVLIADILDSDKFQNHFLLTAAALGPQLLKTYTFGTDEQGNPIPLSVERIRDFFFDVLFGKVEIQPLDQTVTLQHFM